MGLGWLRWEAQGYSYSYIKIELESKVERNFKSFGIQLNWGLDGCARWRKVTITIKYNLKVIFKES